MNLPLETELSQQLKMLLNGSEAHTAAWRKVLNTLAEQLQVEPLTLAAALMQLEPKILADYQAQITTMVTDTTVKLMTKPVLEGHFKQQLAEQFATALNIEPVPTEKNKMVRYRIEIGRSHQVSREDIKNVLINESGVDRSKIGYMDIRHNYTLIDLPPGMPQDIFRLLQTVEIKQRALKIKRIGVVSRQKTWPRHKAEHFSERKLNVTAKAAQHP